VFKGSYAETMTAAIAAYRAGNAPQIVQVFEVGTATMMAAKGAIKPVYQLMADAGEAFDPQSYLPAVTAYYSTADGKMLSLPFNSSTPVVYWNKDAFKKAGLDPDKPPKTWPETFEAAKKLRAAGLSCGFTAAWVSWTQIENFGAWHNLPLATKANGLEGPDAVLEFNNPTVARHIANLAEAEKDKSFDYGGRTTEPTAKFISGDCGMLQDSSASYGAIKAGVKFPFGMTELPYYPDVKGAPQNSIIGGASLWVMGGKKPEEYKGVAKFFKYLSSTNLQVAWHEATGYLPITKAAYEATKASGFYEKNPGTEVALIQMTSKPPTENSRGLRLGNLVQIRDVIAEDLEKAFAGKEDAKTALGDAVNRGNALLRQFQKTVQ
jgi:sn-glycerol 3-phosphate transport system substrate-binding protein